jgi:thiol-disulfide isomerase/thioredoxin
MAQITAMKYTPLFIAFTIATAHCIAQTPAQIIEQVKKAQQQINIVYYKLERHDTLVTGDIRTIAGESKLTVLPTDSIFGFRFWSKRDDINSESVYDGQKSYYIDHDKKTFSSNSNRRMIEASLGSPGGQVIFPDIIRLDVSSSANDVELTEDKELYYLKVPLPDIDQYDVRKRSKTILIDKKTMLPVGIRRHQETLGKVQDLYFRITEIRVNDPAYSYDFAMQRYPEDYKPQQGYVNKKLAALNGKDYPPFSFASFDGKSLSSDLFKGKVVLLDFWEVWCSPCIASIPKVQALYEKYRSKGFEAYGIIHEKENLSSARELIEKRKISFPMGVGTNQSEEDYSIIAVPLYILIDKTGKIAFTSEGYSERLEEEIKKLL